MTRGDAAPAVRWTGPSPAWLAIRLTAVILAVLVLAHFAVTHLVVDVAETGSAFIAERWESGLVAATDWLMLVAAVLHGSAGAWVIVHEYASAPTRARLHRLIAVAGAVMIAGGTITLLAVLS